MNQKNTTKQTKPKKKGKKVEFDEKQPKQSVLQFMGQNK